MSANGTDVNSACIADIETRVACINFEVAVELQRPCNIKKPRVFKYGDQWCALYGENIQEGVCGFGVSPEEACKAFDKEWMGVP